MDYCKALARDFYIVHLMGNVTSCALQSSEVAVANGAAALMRPSIARTNVQLDPLQQLVNTPPDLPMLPILA